MLAVLKKTVALLFMLLLHMLSVTDAFAAGFVCSAGSADDDDVDASQMSHGK